MQALWLEDGTLTLRDVPIPVAKPGDAVIRVRLAGICNTDLELQGGYYQYAGIPGHEFVGVVESHGGELDGQRVVGEINVTCGKCSQCRTGRSSHCVDRTVLGIRNRDGAFAEFTSLPIRNLHVLPDGVPDESAVFVEPLAAALQIQNQVQFKDSDRVAVIGDGKLGNLVAQTLAMTGCELVVVGRHAAKLAFLEARGVATTTEVEDVEGMDIVIECTGNSGGFSTAVEVVRPGGTIVMKSTYSGRLEIDASAIVVNEITLVGSRCGPFGPAIELLQTEKIDVQSLIRETFPLERAVDAFECAATRGVMKVLIRP